MIIEIGKFKLVSSEDRFHVVELKQVETVDIKTRQKTGEVRTEEKEVGYDLRFESAIRYVLDRSLNDQEITMSLPHYIEAFKKEREKITNLLK